MVRSSHASKSPYQRREVIGGSSQAGLEGDHLDFVLANGCFDKLLTEDPSPNSITNEAC
jgi:hypothetical protein